MVLVSLQFRSVTCAGGSGSSSPLHNSAEINTRPDDRKPRKVILRKARSPLSEGNQDLSDVVANQTSKRLSSKLGKADDLPQDSQESEQSGIPVGGWVGIGFGIFLILLIAIYFLIGHRRVTEYFVRIIRDRIQRHDRKISSRQADQETLDSLEVRCSSKSENQQGSKVGSSIGFYETNAGTPMTVNDIPVAPIEIEADGRMSPKLPIPSRQLSGSHVVMTP